MVHEDKQAKFHSRWLRGLGTREEKNISGLIKSKDSKKEDCQSREKEKIIKPSQKLNSKNHKQNASSKP